MSKASYYKAAYDVSQATHKLKCRHQIGSSGFDYYMFCRLLGKTKSGNLRILVFGDRYWVNKSHVKKIRYVRRHRIVPITLSESEAPNE